MHSAEDTANFPNPSTVGPHEFCRRSCERDTVAKLEIRMIICKFRDHIKEFTYMYLIHRNLTYRTQVQSAHNEVINGPRTKVLTVEKWPEDQSANS